MYKHCFMNTTTLSLTNLRDSPNRVTEVFIDEDGMLKTDRIFVLPNDVTQRVLQNVHERDKLCIVHKISINKKSDISHTGFIIINSSIKEYGQFTDSHFLVKTNTSLSLVLSTKITVDMTVVGKYVIEVDDGYISHINPHHKDIKKELK